MAEHILTAFDLIGYGGDKLIRIRGGKALYETVTVKDGYYDGPVILQRLEVRPDGLHTVNRWVDPLTQVELVLVRDGHVLDWIEDENDPGRIGVWVDGQDPIGSTWMTDDETWMAETHFGGGFTATECANFTEAVEALYGHSQKTYPTQNTP